MKKTKQIFAIIGIILLAGLYILTLVFALSGNDNFFGLLMASVIATIIIPIWIWIYERVYVWIRRLAGTDKTGNDADPRD